MARAALNWSIDDLSERIHIQPDQIERFEAGAYVRPAIISAIKAAYESERFIFLMNGPHEGAVIPPRPRPGDAAPNPLIDKLMRDARPPSTKTLPKPPG